MLHNVINHYILTCGSICGAVQLVYKFFAVECGMRTELSGAVQFADKNFAHRTISSLHSAFLHQYGAKLHDSVICDSLCRISPAQHVSLVL